jgi:hypothetical protein
MEQNNAAVSSESALSTLIISLLKGVIYQENDPHLWGALLRLQIQVRDYFRVINLELHLDERKVTRFCVQL